MNPVALSQRTEESRAEVHDDHESGSPKKVMMKSTTKVGFAPKNFELMKSEIKAANDSSPLPKTKQVDFSESNPQSPNSPIQNDKYEKREKYENREDDFDDARPTVVVKSNKKI